MNKGTNYIKWTLVVTVFSWVSGLFFTLIVFGEMSQYMGIEVKSWAIRIAVSYGTSHLVRGSIIATYRCMVGYSHHADALKGTGVKERIPLNVGTRRTFVERM